MKKNYIVICIFIICLCFVGYTGYYLGSATIEPKVVETIVEKEPNIDEIKESLKTEIYDEAYNDGYEKGKTEVFELMLKSENNEEEIVVEDVKPVENKESTNKETVKTEPTTENQSTQPTENQSSTQDNICPICGAVIDEDHILSHGYTNDNGTNTIHEPTLSASNFTWSVSKDGMYTSSEFWTRAQSYVTYYDYDTNTLSATSGLGITINPDGPGTYEIVWSTSSGKTCTQYVTLTE